MSSELPEFASLCARILRRRGRLVLEYIFRAFHLRSRHIQQSEVKSSEIQSLQLAAQQILVPLCNLAGLVVEDAVLALLLLAQTLGNEDFRRGVPEPGQCLVARVAREDDHLLIHHDGRDVAALPDALRHRVHRAFVPPRVVLIRPDILQPHRLELHRAPPSHCSPAKTNPAGNRRSTRFSRCSTRRTTRHTTGTSCSRFPSLICPPASCARHAPAGRGRPTARALGHAAARTPDAARAEA